MEHKKVEFKVEDNKLKIMVDPNQDGEPLMTVIVDITEIPDEVLSAINK